MRNKGKLLATLVFLWLVADIEGTLNYYKELWTPGKFFEWLGYMFPFRLTVFQLLLLLFVMIGRKPRKNEIAKPVVSAIWVSVFGLLFCIVYGVATGGETKPLYTQGIAWAHCIIFFFAAIGAFRTQEEFNYIASAIAYAAVWRAIVASIFFYMVKDRPWQTMPAYMTTHEDTVLFVAGFVVLVSRAIELRTKQARRALYWAGPIILAGIQFNNRRLAWVSLAFGLAILYFMLPAKSKITRRVNRSLLTASPIIVAYVVIGWGSSAKIFKPLASFSSVGGGKVDASTQARDNENMGLVIMIGERPILGTGFGHQWLEVDHTHAVPLSVFPMYYYCPHNSVMALFAFCGCFGFAALWMVIPVSVFLNARTYRVSQNPAERVVAVTGIAYVVAYLNQAYGDMGAMGPPHLLPATFLGLSIASAARLSVASGAWPGVGMRKAQLRTISSTKG